LSPEDEQSWLDGKGTDFATSLISCGACASLLAGLAASGIAQQFGIPHNDALAVHALQLAQVWRLSEDLMKSQLRASWHDGLFPGQGHMSYACLLYILSYNILSQACSANPGCLGNAHACCND